jgi:FkbM family methyltransferase
MSEFKVEWVAEHLGHPFPKVIIDAGTFDGSDAVAFKDVFPDARVLAIEACPDNFVVMKGRGWARSAGVEIHHAALCDFDGEVPFFSNSDTHFPGHFGQSGSVLTPTNAIDNKWRGGMGHIRFRGPRMVPARRLDTFCAAEGITDIDLLHMDVQGAESMVLDGMGELRPKMIFLEIDEVKETGGYVGCVPKQELVARLTSRGYVNKWESATDALYVHD